MTYAEIEKLIEQNKVKIINGDDVQSIQSYREWNEILEKKLKDVRLSVYSKLLK